MNLYILNVITSYSIHYTKLYDEIADVRIMIEQAQILFPADKIKDRIIFKMARLEKRIVEGLP